MNSERKLGQPSSKLPPVSQIDKTVLRDAVNIVDVLTSTDNQKELSVLHVAATSGNPVNPEEIPFAMRGLESFGHINSRQRLTEEFRSCILAVLQLMPDGSYCINDRYRDSSKRSTRIRPTGSISIANYARTPNDSDSSDEIEPEFTFEEDDDDDEV
jgi:hypothetical protein